MGLLLPILILGGFIIVATFLVMWHFRGRGFAELIPGWSRKAR